MILDLEPIFNTEGFGQDFSFTLDLSDETLDGVRAFSSPVEVTGRVENQTGIVELHAVAACALSLCCDRCAKPITPAFRIPVDHTLVTSLNDEANDALYLIEDLRFDLDPLVREDLFLSLPAKFLCRPDCKGLCPVCGQDLNDGPCGCKRAIDPRLAALAALLDAEDPEGK
ncbi:MAG: DUF177 domain-containing protein [Clostridia bacterium]|nr:DUF177 domain-containing protein [Clostridia bacterium]